MFKRYVDSKSLFLTTLTLLIIWKDVIKTVQVHPLGIFPTFLLQMNISRCLLNVPIGKINIVQTFKKRKEHICQQYLLLKPRSFFKKKQKKHCFICPPISLYFPYIFPDLNAARIPFPSAGPGQSCHAGGPGKFDFFCSKAQKAIDWLIIFIFYIKFSAVWGIFA